EQLVFAPAAVRARQAPGRVEQVAGRPRLLDAVARVDAPLRGRLQEAVRARPLALPPHGRALTPPALGLPRRTPRASQGRGRGRPARDAGQPRAIVVGRLGFFPPSPAPPDLASRPAPTQPDTGGLCVDGLHPLDRPPRLTNLPDDDTVLPAAEV